MTSVEQTEAFHACFDRCPLEALHCPTHYLLLLLLLLLLGRMMQMQSRHVRLLQSRVVVADAADCCRS